LRSLPLASVGWPGGWSGGVLLMLVTVLVAVAGRRRRLRRFVVVVLIATAVGAVPVRLRGRGWRPDRAVVVACSVGQGDAVVLPAAAGEAVVVDAGPEPAAVDRCLRGLRV